MRFSLTTKNFHDNNYPIKVILWTEGSHEYSELVIESPEKTAYSGVYEAQNSRYMLIQIISTSSSKKGVNVLTWHGTSKVSIYDLSRKYSKTITIKSASDPFPINGEVIISNVTDILKGKRHFNFQFDEKNIINPQKLNRKNIECLKKYKAIDPRYPHAINSMSSEFYDIFFYKLNNLNIPVSHILLSPKVYFDTEKMIKRLVFITASRLGKDIHELSGNHAMEGDFLSYMLLYMVNYTTYCEDWNISGKKKQMAEKIRPNIQIVSSSDCEDTAMFNYFFYEMILNSDSTDEDVMKIKQIARRYVPFVQLGAVGSHRMVETSNGMVPYSSSHGQKSSFEAHSYFQLMPVEFVRRNMSNDIVINKEYNFDYTEFNPKLDHLIIEGTNLCVTSRSVNLEIPKNATRGLDIPKSLSGKYKTMNYYPENFYNYMLIGMSGMFHSSKNTGKPLQFIFKRKNTHINYGTMYSDSITLRDDVYEILPTEYYTDDEILYSKNILREELPIYIDGRVDYSIPRSWRKLWVSELNKHGINNSIDSLKKCAYEAVFSVYESMDMKICTEFCRHLKTKGVTDVCLAYECVGKGLWGISLGIPKVTQTQ